MFLILYLTDDIVMVASAEKISNIKIPALVCPINGFDVS